jgi:RimJ/RimL family protein N-acetyltransferase
MQELLQNREIKLKRFKPEDGVDVFNALKFSYKEISPWLSWLKPDYDQKSANDFIYLQMSNWNQDLEYAFSIKSHTDDLLGTISLHLYDKQNKVASLGYWMNSQYTSKGICTNAVKLLIANTLIKLKLNRIEVIVATKNIASQKVAEKAGAKYEAILKNRLLLLGKPTDAKMYAFTKCNS